MSRPLAETYARSPEFYSGTFCSGCSNHFPVGADGEFVWSGTEQRVGTRRAPQDDSSAASVGADVALAGRGEAGGPADPATTSATSSAADVIRMRTKYIGVLER